MATIETTTKITIDMLTESSVSILKQEVAEINGQEVQIGQNWRCAYVNSASDRARLQDHIGDPYYTSVIAVWGDAPTVEEGDGA